jgi:hypothetical protein
MNKKNDQLVAKKAQPIYTPWQPVNGWGCCLSAAYVRNRKSLLGVIVMPEPDPVIEQLKERAWQQVAAINAALAAEKIDEDGWHAAMAAIIKQAYLSADNPYGQAGHNGDASSWEAARSFIAAALHRNGSFLDAGCAASGIMMESVQRWGAAKNLSIEPYGLEIIPECAEMARRRLPQWAGRIFTGNIRTWRPLGEKFTYVLIRPEYAPPGRRAEMAGHIIDHVLKPGGRLIVFVGTEEAEARSMENSITMHGFVARGRAEIPHPRDNRVMRRIFWIDGPGF